MIKIFALVLNMSISASCAVMIVLVIRLLLKRVPKIFSYFLWLAVFVRFLIPVAWETNFGIIPALSVVQVRESYSHSYTVHHYTPNEIEDSEGQDGLLGNDSSAGQFAVEEKVYLPNEEQYAEEKASLPNEEQYSEDIISLPNEEIEETEYVYDMEKTVNVESSVLGVNIEVPVRIMRILAIVWCIVGILLILYQVISYGLFMGRLHRESGSGNKETGEGRSLYTWSSDAVQTPFVGGIFCPVVYLPEGLDETRRELILEHEKIHIRRLDYLIKPAAMLVCCIYWFNPFAWLAFYLMERDMENSCDEAVLRKVGYDRKKEYAGTLLDVAERGGWKPGHPIAFGESNVKNRIKRTVKLKKAKLGTVVIGVVVTFPVIVLLLVNRSGLRDSQEAAEVAAPPSETMPSEPSEAEEPTAPPSETVPSEPSGAEAPAAPATPPEEPDASESSEEREQSEVSHEETGGGAQITNYVPSRDHFENILLTVDGPVNEVEILYDYPVVYTYIADVFGTRIHPVTREEIFHSGIDFAADTGTAVTAAADGKVVKTGYDDENGNYVIIQHINGDMTYYAMCETIVAGEGDEVKRGEQIATVGSTGKSTGPHLHFAVSRNGSYIEPRFAKSAE